MEILDRLIVGIGMVSAVHCSQTSSKVNEANNATTDLDIDHDLINKTKNVNNPSSNIATSYLGGSTMQALDLSRAPKHGHPTTNFLHL